MQVHRTGAQVVLALLLHLPLCLSLPTYTCNWKTTGQLVSRSGVNPTVIHSTFAPMAHTDNILIICIMCASVSMLAQVLFTCKLKLARNAGCMCETQEARANFASLCAGSWSGASFSSCFPMVIVPSVSISPCVSLRGIFPLTLDCVLLMISHGNRPSGSYSMVFFWCVIHAVCLCPSLVNSN